MHHSAPSQAGLSRRRWQTPAKDHDAPSAPSSSPRPAAGTAARNGAPEPGLLCPLRGRLARCALWPCHGFSYPGVPGLKRRLLAVGLSCCTMLAFYAASSLRELPPAWGCGNDEGDEPVTVPFGRSRPLGGCKRRFGIRACNLFNFSHGTPGNISRHTSVPRNSG